MPDRVKFFVCMVVAALVAGCGSEQKSEEAAKPAQGTVTQGAKEPDVIAVQHVLVAFEGSLPGKPVTRSREEARQLAEEILAKARSGGDFDAMVKQYTDDSYPGIYRMANYGATADPAQQVYPRGGMVPAFGDVGFSLKVGEVGMAAHSLEESPYGWHVIKRIE